MHQFLNIINIIQYNQTIQIIQTYNSLYGRFGFIKQYTFLQIHNIQKYIFSVSRILTSDHLYSQIPNDSKLTVKCRQKYNTLHYLVF